MQGLRFKVVVLVTVTRKLQSWNVVEAVGSAMVLDWGIGSVIMG